jgi:Dolichyl-phosphate-mannose-protein mannosyltransferase
LISGAARIIGAFMLPNAFGDAYVYIRDAGVLRSKIVSGTFALTDLYGFWLPLYQFICGLVSVVINQPFYVGKVVSAIFGIGVCLLVFAISLRLTTNRVAALLAFLLIALNPLHILYSASAMTDIPHAFFVLASLYFALDERWILAAVMAALAGLTRMDSWMFLVILPALQLLKERRVSIVGVMILALPPLFWLYISWKARGDPWACFVERKQYMDALLANSPRLAHLSLAGIVRDGSALLISTDLAVLVACFVGAWLTLKQMAASVIARQSENLYQVLRVSAYFFAFLSFLVLAYLTHKQPIIYHRYGLITFALGIPMLPWTYLKVTAQKPQWARRVFVSIVILCTINSSLQLVGCIGFLNQTSAQRAVADYLRTHFQPNDDAHIFSDEGTVLALSGIPPERFLSSSDAPKNREAFRAYLKERHVEYLVFVDKEDSTPAQLFPELKSGVEGEMFRQVMRSRTRFLHTDILVYEVINTSAR